MAPAKCLNDIAVELRAKIISYIVRPADLQNLCLTSKAIRELATPLLYRKVILFIGGPGDVVVSSMLSRTNPGLQHIRKVYLRLEKVIPLRIVDADSSDDSSDEEETSFEDRKVTARTAQLTVRLLLDFLPRDILEGFSFYSWEPFSVDNWVLLLKNQRRLKAANINSVDRLCMPLIKKHPDLFKNLTEITTLYFCPDTVDRMQSCQKMLEAHPNIRKLQLNHDSDRGTDHPREDLHDSSTRPGLLFRTMFSHMLPLETCTPLKLTKMFLDNIDVRYAADTYMKAIDFSCLESLSVGICPGADAIFSQMGKPHIRPSRLKRLYWFHDETAEPHALEAFEGLLEGLSGLEVLHVELNNVGGLPKSSAIIRHSKTLRVLALSSRMGAIEQPQLDRLKCYEEAQFNEICTQCTELRQLSITTPETFVSEPQETASFRDFLACAAKLPYLVTLNLQRWPQTMTPFISSYEKLKFRALDLYQYHLQRLAQQIFSTSDAAHLLQGWGLGNRSRLNVIAFGGNGSTRFDEARRVELKQMPYVRGVRVGPFGEQELCATRILWPQVGWVEPESEVLGRSMSDLLYAHRHAR